MTFLIQEALGPYVAAINADFKISGVPFAIKTAYHKTATGSEVIGGKSPYITEFCQRLKNDRERARHAITREQQIHRTELEEARAAKEEARLAKEAARAAKKKEKALSKVCP